MRNAFCVIRGSLCCGNIVLKVIKFPAINVVIEMNKFIALCPYSVMAFHCMLTQIFVVVVVKRFTPFCVGGLRFSTTAAMILPGYQMEFLFLQSTT